ncbi:hypothetical protein IG631_23718 [Alternaria alternata]|nr:hypothetical protein IG631_23718 [Alternaria alternata]
MSQQSKMRNPKTFAKAISRKRAIVRPTGNREPQGAVAGVPPLRSRRSGDITPSTRYQ